MLAVALTLEDSAKLVELEVAFLTEGKAIEDFAQHCRPYPSPKEEIATHAVDIANLSQDAAKREQIKAFLARAGTSGRLYLPATSYILFA